MSDLFLKALECSCVKGTSATCATGGEVAATLSASPASISATLESEAKIVSPGKSIQVTFNSISGSGPYYLISGCQSGENCDLVDDTWTVTIAGLAGAVPFEFTADIVSVNSSNSCLIYLNDVFSPEDVNTITVSGFAHPTPPEYVRTRSVGQTLESDTEVDSVLSIRTSFDLDAFLAETEIDEDIKADYCLNQQLEAEGTFTNTNTDKVNGYFSDYTCQQIMYPSGDLSIEDGYGSFIAVFNETENLYSYIDEGVYQGILKDQGNSVLLSDDANSYIHPDTIHTEGLFQYKCALTELYVRPDDSYLRMRVSAPLRNYESNIAPMYTVYNIRLSDPSGNLIIKYNDFVVKGDSDQEHPNYTTYSTHTETNVVAEKYDWQRRNQPHMHEVSGYSLSFNIRAVALDDAFTEGFNEGFEENFIIPDIFDVSGNNYLALDGSPLSTQEQHFINPTDGFRISAVEICNSGGVGFGYRAEDLLTFYAEVPETGRRLEREIKPVFMPLYNFDSTIWPSVSSVWESSNDSSVNNLDKCGAEELVKIINNSGPDSITLNSMGGDNIADSGKLTLKFSHGFSPVSEVTLGAFNSDFDQNTEAIWFSPSGAYNTENTTEGSRLNQDLSFIDIDTLTLKVVAKKAASTRDYVLDVVGYSDDKLLNVTPASGGFIQDPSGVTLNDLFVSNVGQHPIVSGFYTNGNDLALGGTAISQKEKYYEASGNDHYKLTQYPVVTGTDFETYEVPLIINNESVLLGKARDFSLSSLFEHVYLDIFPLPSGASIREISLCARYKPQNAVQLYTQGGEEMGKVQDGRSEAALFPSGMKSYDSILNAGSGYAPVSTIEGVPHSFTTPDTIKTNYSRRWRGREGTVKGPYDIDQFSFGFENPLLDYPFLSGYYKFDDIDTGYVKSVSLGEDGYGTVSGLIVGDLEVYQNLGWRLASGTLFQDAMPGFSGNYTTTDWTSLSKGSTTFVGNPLYGKIADAFDRVVRISGESQNINFGNIDTASGFSVFARFTPDVNVSGAGYDLFESGILFAKWDTAEQLDFALAYSGGYLCGYAQDNLGNIIQVSDTISYSGYQFPLNVILTYNDHNQSGLKLYTDNEFYKGEFPVLRSSGGPFYKNTTDADLVLGFGAGSGVGMNMLVSEFGISTWASGVYGSGTNIVGSNADRTYREVTAENFLFNSRVKFFDPDESTDNDSYKLWDRVNEDTYNDWYLGAFQNCMFSSAYDEWQVRPNMEQVVFDIKHHGSGYIQSADLPVPSAIHSGVAYHTQIENDFLRFHLTDVPDNFYAVNKRITKSLPIGYKFSEKALVVESVIKHESSGDLVWPDCDSPEGPRLIVSLYTKNKDPYWNPDEPNWGLVNRKVDYIPPSACIFRFDATFTYDDICETSEEWAIFPEEPRIREFGETYFSDDVNDMFVQYDLVYPSGPAFNSRLELHSSHVRMADANILSLDDSGVMNLYASGGFAAEEFFNLVCGEFPTSGTNSLPLLIGTPLPLDNLEDTSGSGFAMMTSGAIRSNEILSLFTPLQSGVEYLNLYVSGQEPELASGSMNLAMPFTLGFFDTSNDADPGTTPGDAQRGGGGQGGGAGTGSPAAGGPGKDAIVGRQPAANVTRSFFGLPMVLLGETGQLASGDVPLYLYATDVDPDSTGGYASLPFTMWNTFNSNETGSDSGVLNLTTRAITKITSRFRNASMPLYISAPLTPSAVMPLFITNYNDTVQTDASVNLMTASYPVGAKGTGSAYGLWYNNDFGTGIELDDNRYSSLSVDNEIRGIDFAAYGSCTGNSPSKAIDPALVTDCTVWRDATCNEGGIFRANQTYTNSGALGFDDATPGYSGNYYGIRKFTQLLPSLNYNTVLKVRTGSTEAIPVPRNFEEWEYGMCGPAWYDGGCCTEDCDQNIVYSGVKLIGDDACSVPPSANLCVDSDLIVASGRQQDANYGKAVAVKNDLMAVGAPNQTIPEYDIYSDPPAMVDVSGAGSVFLYRRGADVAGKKASWELETQLMLPVGYRKDYPQRTINNLLQFDNFTISGVKWQIGQEGRQFGESLDICSSGDREIAVVGAPRAKWTRNFEDIVTSGIPTAAIVFADRFSYNRSDIARIAATAKRFDILWKYFSAPWYGGQPEEFQPQIDTKVLVVQSAFSTKNNPVVPTDQSSWFKHVYIPRLDDYDLIIDEGSGVYEAAGQTGTQQQYFNSGLPVVFSNIVSGVQDAFFELFPSGRNDVLYSGVPAIVGLFQEQSSSSLGALTYVDENNNTRSIYKDFENFYNGYSPSGVFNQITGQPESGNLNIIEDRSEDWAESTIDLIYNTFDSGRLASTFTNSTLNQFFITSGVGQEFAQEFNINEFQIPPASGGRVYIFEKERGNWNCIQQLISPNDTSDFYGNFDDWYLANSFGKEFNDRYGHAVSISQNGEVVSVGSPFTGLPCQIFERDEEANNSFYAAVRNFAVYLGDTDAIAHYDDILALSGATSAQQSTYDRFDDGLRFKLRTDVNFWNGNPPSVYEQVFDYKYGDIEYIGTNKFIHEEFAPGSRLGWSTAASDQGDVVAFGAPTDSFNMFEDGNVYHDDELTFASYHNAGAVRVFEARKYHPHDKIVEFGLFGNLDRSYHDAERNLGYYDIWPQVFASGADGTVKYSGLSWRRMDFSEIEIPADAGLAFIITPEIDAASDEVIDNIKNWLALGDRNLVLVGNDPVWEENGLYEDSNEVINKILKKLGSRMILQPARSEEYSLQGCVDELDVEDNRFNITASFRPTNGTARTIGTSNYFGKGFADIRINLEADGQEGFEEYMECPEGLDGEVINARCEFPLEHLGDLRAQWAEECIENNRKVRYLRNWPQMFNNVTQPCDVPPVDLVLDPRQEPVPVLTTAEHLPDQPWYVPAESGLVYDLRPIEEWRTWSRSDTIYSFEDDHIDRTDFDIFENNESEVSGVFNDFSLGKMYDPDYLNDRDALVQASAVPYLTGFNRTRTQLVYEDHIVAVAESGKTDNGELNGSRVYLIATQWSEDDASRGIDAGTDNDDKNTEFYLNLVTNDCDNSSGPRGIQINGFTGRTSLNNAYFYYGDDNNGHSLANKFRAEFSRNSSVGYFNENQETSALNEFVDFAWVAHPSGKPSDLELSNIKNWLDKGDKRLIITYNAANPADMRQVARNVDYLCSGINVTSRPLFVPSLGDYHVSTTRLIDSYRGQGSRFDDILGARQNVNYATDSISGCDDGYAYNNVYNSSTALSGLHFSEQSKVLYNGSLPAFGNIGLDTYDRHRVIPISGGQDYERIMWFPPDIFEKVEIPPVLRYRMSATSTFKFPTVVDSGYRFFFDWVSETQNENKYIELNFQNISTDPDPSNIGDSLAFVRLDPTSPLSPNNGFIDFRATEEEIVVTATASHFIGESEVENEGLPYSTRVIAMSGAPLVINEEVKNSSGSGLYTIGYERFNERYEVEPARSGVIEGGFRPVSHQSSIYCNPTNGAGCENLGDNLIEDGPVVAAEEYENFSSFPAGRRKSKIILISDSTIVQGQCPEYRASAITKNQEFIRSLYPASPEDYDRFQDDADYFDDDYTIREGRNFYFAQKIRAPERGSAAKYYAVSGVNNTVLPYGDNGSFGSLGNYTDREDLINPQTLDRPVEIRGKGKRKERLKRFNNSDAIGRHGIYPRFSGDFLDINNYNGGYDYYDELLALPSGTEKDFIVDMGIGGGLTDLMKINNTDYLDLEVYYSGCLGDLFGYSVDITDDKLIVGAPFNAFEAYSAVSGISGIVQWHEIQNGESGSGIRIAEDGGAGAAFVFNRTGSGENIIEEFLPWDFVSKIKPSSLNVGIYDFSPDARTALIRNRGIDIQNNSSFILQQAKRSDNFGVSVSIDCDMAAIGAPNHDFETLHHHIYSGVVAENGSGLSSAFLRKSFNGEYDIPYHSFYDLGSSGVRVDDFDNNSGVGILNNGAVFNYRYELTDFQKREQVWKYAEKLVPLGYKDRTATTFGALLPPDFETSITSSGTENDRFGRAVAIDRAYRGDSDYTLVVGSPQHDWPTSGNHPTSGVSNAGAVYNFDAMLREQIPAIPNSGGFIDVKVFADGLEEPLFTRVYQNTSGDSTTTTVSGIVTTNANGDVFLEVSGFDPATKGFIAHRPYVESVQFSLANGNEENDNMQLFIDGKPVEKSGVMNLVLSGDPSAIVYNNVNLYNFGVSGAPSGSMNLFLDAPSGYSSGTMNLVVGNQYVTDSLELRIRGY